MKPQRNRVQPTEELSGVQELRRWLRIFAPTIRTRNSSRGTWPLPVFPPSSGNWTGKLRTGGLPRTHITWSGLRKSAEEKFLRWSCEFP
jgi:hypothetical protein